VLLAFGLGLLLLVLLPAIAQASDVALTVNPTAYVGGIVIVNGGVSCTSTTVEATQPLSVSIRQSGAQVQSSFGQASCTPDPELPGSAWTASVPGAQLHPGRASVTVQLTLADGTEVIATGPVRLIIPNKPTVEHVDVRYSGSPLDAFCGFPPYTLQFHDVGLQQTWEIRGGGAKVRPISVGLIEKFTGTETITNPINGKSVVLKQSPRVTTDLSDGSYTFTGLNYQIRTSSGHLVSSGRAVTSSTGEDLTVTPHLTHAFPVLCGLLS
jgi:hypothetical protein